MTTLPSSTNSLDALAAKYGTDKGSADHDYTPLYEQHLGPMRYAPLTLLELGVKDAASLRMWRDWLPHATIVGLDITPMTLEPDLHTYCGDQADEDLLRRIHHEHGDFDVIIDDASHLSSKSIASWRALWPRLKPGGLYVVEDTHSSYHSQFYGENEACLNPDGNVGLTMMHWLKRMADEVNYHGPENDLNLFPRQYWKGYSLAWITFYFNICFAKKL